MRTRYVPDQPRTILQCRPAAALDHDRAKLQRTAARRAAGLDDVTVDHTNVPLASHYQSRHSSPRRTPKLGEKEWRRLPKGNVCGRAMFGWSKCCRLRILHPRIFKAFWNAVFRLLDRNGWSLHLGQPNEHESSAEDSGLFCVTPSGCSQTSLEGRFSRVNGIGSTGT